MLPSKRPSASSSRPRHTGPGEIGSERPPSSAIKRSSASGIGTARLRSAARLPGATHYARELAIARRGVEQLDNRGGEFVPDLRTH